MAHADYVCCAICDSKLYYDSMPDSKTELCVSCALNITEKAGVRIATPEDLMDWMKSNDPEVVISVLDSIGFSKCYYSNDVDTLYEAIKEKVQNQGKDS